MQILAKAWILAAVAAPLTVFTISLWWVWVYLVERKSKGALSWRHKLFSIRIKSSTSPTGNDCNESDFARSVVRDIESGIVLPMEKHPEAASIGSSTSAVKAD
jgi:hypothetical protein